VTGGFSPHIHFGGFLLLVKYRVSGRTYKKDTG
jgi:hypothetical protein